MLTDEWLAKIISPTGAVDQYIAKTVGGYAVSSLMDIHHLISEQDQKIENKAKK